MSTMRGMLYIVRGQYRHGKRPYYISSITDEPMCIGGYDPEDTSNSEWYMLMNTQTWSVIASGTDLEKVLQCAYNIVIKYKGKAERFIKTYNKYRTEVRGVQRELEEQIYDEYGDYYQDLVDEQVEKAYEDLREVAPSVQTSKRLKTVRKKVKKVTVQEEAEHEEEEPQKKVKIHKGIRIRR